MNKGPSLRSVIAATSRSVREGPISERRAVEVRRTRQDADSVAPRAERASETNAQSTASVGPSESRG